MPEPKPKAAKARTRLTRRTGRPTLYDGKVETALMVRPQDLALLTRLAKRLKCSRSDALANIISRNRAAILDDLSEEVMETEPRQKRRA